MKRRHFLALSAFALINNPVRAGEGAAVEFTREAYEKALESGEPFLLDFTASW